LSWRHTVWGSLSNSNSTKTLVFYYKIVSDSAKFHSENTPKITVINSNINFFKWKSWIWSYESWFLGRFRAKCRWGFRLVSWQNNLISFRIKSVTFLLQIRIWFAFAGQTSAPFNKAKTRPTQTNQIRFHNRKVSKTFQQFSSLNSLRDAKKEECNKSSYHIFFLWST
jgi:hypothetical protein